MPLATGAAAPDLTLPSSQGEAVALSALWREGPLVVLFFPLAFTSTCTEELCTVGGDLAAYAELGARVVAVSVDSPFALERYRREVAADFPFLSDFNRDAARAFDVLRAAPLGPGLRDVSDRSAFVVDTQGRIAYAWHSANPGLLPPFAEIKASLQALAAPAA